MEVEIDILSRLPVKSLIRFRCVCKNWLALLTTDTHFINLHLARTVQSNKENPKILLSEIGSGRKTLIYSAPDFDHPIKLESPVKRPHVVIGSCNGILCLKHRGSDNDMYLWNPATGEHCIIPNSFPVHHKTAHFDFGFSEITNQYKVVKVSADSEVTVHTIGTNAWRSLGKIPYSIYLLSNSRSNVLVNGALHWILLEGLQYAEHRVRFVIVSFDLKEEVFGKMTMPYDSCQLSLGNLGGLICLLFDNRELWVMKKYGVVSSWTKIVSLEQSFGFGSRPVGGMRLVGIWNNGDLVVFKFSGILLCYNREGQLIKKIKCSISKNCVEYGYIGSLVSPILIPGVGPEDDKSKLIQRGIKQQRNSEGFSSNNIAA